MWAQRGRAYLKLRTMLFVAVATFLMVNGVPRSASVRAYSERLVQQAGTERPVLAFYYMWYAHSTWCLCQMSDLPLSRYDSSEGVTIDRQVQEAAQAGITGFISSWWGPNSPSDLNFAKLLTRSAQLEAQTGIHFTSTIYLESDAPGLGSVQAIASALRYFNTHYGAGGSHLFRWHGKLVIFIWNPVGNGRTLADWATIRRQVDPNHRMIWSAEGTTTNLLDVFDGIHLFSAAYWGLQNGTMPAVDQGFRAKVDAYNAAHHANKIWAAGVLPGYDDTRVPGRQNTYTMPRNNGATYKASWAAAISSHPDWVTITTFNEWFEGAMIEPSVHYGKRYLNLTRQLTTQWRTHAP